MSLPDDLHLASPFVPGSVLAGRYRMVTRIGRGGMGEVWRADDLVLQTPVALKWIGAATPEARARILNEVRLARQITHPAVCRVFDVGEAEGQVFYSMELVEGEDLATLMRRLGRLPVEKVVDIGHQICGGLSAAHAQGVLHRDLKPANVLIDNDGRIRITDFGIAITRGEAGPNAAPVGTREYMAPEQFVPGGVVSERTDIYGLGLVLYELLVGRRPFEKHATASARPPRPSALVPDVDPRLDRIILRALAYDPSDRPASVEEVAAHVPRTNGPQIGRRTHPWLAGAGIAAVVAIVAIASAWFVPRARALTDQDTIVLADFNNTTGETVFDGTLKVALAVALEQSPFLKVFPDDRAREMLRLMQRAPDERVTLSVAREIARREQFKALVAASIGSLGTHYVLAVEAISAETGDVMAREQVEVAAKEQVLTALGTATGTLRRKLGESLASIQKFDVPLARATTGSLDALRAYSLALDEGRVTPRPEAIPYLQRAIELDPNFALAHALLSGVYYNTGRSAEAPPFSRKAFDLRERVSEHERFVISWRYYLDAEQALDKALDLSLSWTGTYPRDAFAFNSLGLASGAFGQHDQGVKAFREAIRLDPGFVPPYGNLGGSLIASNRFDEAKALLREAAARGVDSLGLRRTAYTIALIENDPAMMARQLDLVRSSPDAGWAPIWEAHTSALSGRFQRVHDLFQSSVQAALRDNHREVAAQWIMEDAEAHAIAGQCADARREVPAGLVLSRDNFTLERAGRTLALCDAGADAARLSADLTRRFLSATMTNRLQLPVMAAAQALSRGESDRAVAGLEPVKPYDWVPAAEFWPPYIRGQAYLQLKDGRSARAQFQAIIDHRGAAATSPLYALAHLGLARSAALTGEIDTARRAYKAFLDLWSTADQGLQPLQDARQEYARLQ